MSNKVYINPPNLPSTVSGDGRAVMTLLRKFVGEVTDQVNLLNGFVPAESTDSIPIPAYFYLTFNSSGHEFEWSEVSVPSFAYYELRSNQNVGALFGLLARTTELKTSVSLANRIGTVYLYVVLDTGAFSRPYTLSYNKPFPIAPTDVAVTKTDEGTMIFFSKVPFDCVGANVYINQIRYNTDTNIYLYRGDEIVVDIMISFYDMFGEGDFVDIYFYPPAVKNFIVERNAHYLDFRWDNVNLYGVEYVIRKCKTNVWTEGEIISRQKANSFRYVFPNDGDYFFLIKAYDIHGNTSEDATWVNLLTVPDNSRNVISVQSGAPYFDGSKVNLVNDGLTSTLVLPGGSSSGEYYSEVHLHQQYRARNWVDYDTYSLGDPSGPWSELTFGWESEQASISWSGVLLNNVVVVKNEIAMYRGIDDSIWDYFSLNNTLVSQREVEPSTAIGVDYGDCYYAPGLEVTPITSVAYPLALPSNFSCVFNLKTSELFRSGEGVTGALLSFSREDGGWLRLMYDSVTERFSLVDSSYNSISCSVDFTDNDVLFIGVGEWNGIRKLFLKSRLLGGTDTNFVSVPNGNYKHLWIGNQMEVDS